MNIEQVREKLMGREIRVRGYWLGQKSVLYESQEGIVGAVWDSGTGLTFIAGGMYPWLHIYEWVEDSEGRLLGVYKEPAFPDIEPSIVIIEYPKEKYSCC